MMKPMRNFLTFCWVILWYTVGAVVSVLGYGYWWQFRSNVELYQRGLTAEHVMRDFVIMEKEISDMDELFKVAKADLSPSRSPREMRWRSWRLLHVTPTKRASPLFFDHSQRRSSPPARRQERKRIDKGND